MANHTKAGIIWHRWGNICICGGHSTKVRCAAMGYIIDVFQFSSVCGTKARGTRFCGFPSSDPPRVHRAAVAVRFW